MAKLDFSELPYLIVGAIVVFQEELMKSADQLVEKGRSMTPEGRKKMVDEKTGLVSKSDDFSQIIALTVQRALENIGIVTREDLRGLDRRIDALERKISGPARKPPKQKPARRPAKKPAKRPSTKAPSPTPAP